MAVFRKNDRCLNCDASLDSNINYCPSCGQKNTHNNVLLTTLLKDYFGEAFSLDSRFLKSIKPFFFKPGYLTDQFNAGKRVSFINPVRLYLAMSLFYFFVLSLALTRSFNLNEAVVLDEPSSENVSIPLDSLRTVLDKEVGLDSLARQLNVNIDSTTDVNTIKDYMDFLKDRKVSDQQVLDSLGMVSNATNLKLASQVRKIVRKDLDVFIPFLLQNVPIMMLLLLPIFAFILKVLYLRGKVLYIRHLVHGLYLHSFAYLIYGIAALLLTYIALSEDVSGWISFGSFVLVSVYTYVSFLTVYKQGWFKTFIKFALAGYIYSFFLMFFAVGEFIISFYLF